MSAGEEDDRPDVARSGGELRLTAARAAVVVLVVAGFLALWQARDLVFLLVLGLLFGSALAGPIDLLERRRVPRWAGGLLVIAVLAASLGSLGAWLGPRIAEQAGQVERQLPAAVERLSDRFGVDRLADDEEVEQTARDELLASGRSIVRQAFRLLSSLVGAVAALLLVVAIAAWYAVGPDAYRRALVTVVPDRRRGAARRSIERVERTWRRWLAGQLVSMTVIGVLTTLALLWLDSPAPLALGALAGLAEFVPVFGPVLSAVPAVLLAFLDGPRTAAYVLLAYLLIQQLESNVLTPLVMRRAVKVPPLLTLLAGSLFVLLGGLLGLLVAVPVLAGVLAVVRGEDGEGG